MNCLAIFLFLAAIKFSVTLVIFRNDEISVKKPVISTRDKIRSGRIVGGLIAEKGSEFLPFYTSLYVIKTTGVTLCAGSIIAENFVISAGHCFENVEQVFVLAGFTSSEIFSYTFLDLVSSKNVFVHPEYNSSTIANDIALIRLSQNLIFSEIIQKITLPSAESEFLNKNGIVSGFGVYSDATYMISNVLRYTFVTVANALLCFESYGSTFFNQDQQLCIDTTNGHASCSGDSGGSLVIFENDVLTLAGIVSYGSSEGCELGHPEVYTKVSAYLSWINEKLIN